jgi:hypothetical protein
MSKTSESETKPDAPPNGKVADSEDSFQQIYFPLAYAERKRAKDTASTIGSELGRESAILIRSAFAE